MDFSSPTIIVGGGQSGDAAGSADLTPLQITYEDLLSGAAEIVDTGGTRTLNLSSAAIASAASWQIGQTETAADVASNFKTLTQIAAFCQSNNIGIHVEADLTFAPTWPSGAQQGHNELVDQWAPIAAQVGLPITGVEDVQETSTSQPTSSFANTASIEVNAIHTLLEDYAASNYQMTTSNLAVGDMEGGTSSAASSWWLAYDTAATAAGMPTFSYVTADTGWFGSWINEMSVPTWHSFLAGMSSAAAAAHMSLTVDVQGTLTDPTAGQYIEQAEQNAADLAMLQATGSVDVSSVLIQSWGALPVGVGMVTSPTSSVNEAAEIEATYPLYLAGSITASGLLSLNAPSQIILNVGSIHPIVPLAVDWDPADATAGGRLAVVVIDQTGTLAAIMSGSGSVSNLASNILILSGTSADLTAELSSVTLLEATAGPDTIDVESYSTTGRVSDNQISVLAAAPGESVSAINSTNNLQGWTSSSSFLNSGTIIAAGSVLTSETLYWNTTGSLGGTITGTTSPGQSGYVNIVSIHEPLAEYGVENVSSIAPGITNAVADIYDPSADVDWISGSYANNAGINNITVGLTSWLSSAFDAAADLTALIVQSTVNTFDSQSGMLQSSVETLAPDPITVVDRTGTHSDSFATAFDTGGTQVVEYNTGTNPSWKLGWGNQFNSATLTYDGTGQLTELFLQGGASDPAFTIDYIFDPTSGKLWEEFQTASPPPEGLGTTNYAGTSNPYDPGYVTGPEYITQFNTSGTLGSSTSNPNWDYVDWGSSVGADTEVWTDYFIMANFTGFATDLSNQSGPYLRNYSAEFVNRSQLDLMYLPGTNIVDLNALQTVTIDSQTTASNMGDLNAIDAAGATGIVSLTGLKAGGSTLIGGDSISTLTGFGHDTIVAGSGLTTISTGAGGSAVSLSSSAGTTTLSGPNNRVTGIASSTIFISGSNETVNGSNMTINVGAYSSVTVNGTGDTINIVGADIILTASANNRVLVSDTAADVQTNLDRLEALTSNGDLVSITLTDIGTPTLNLSLAQTVSDAAVLACIRSPYILASTAADTSQVTATTGIATSVIGSNEASATVTTASVAATSTTTEQAAGISNATTGLATFDTTTNETSNLTGKAYSGPVTGLTTEIITPTSDSLNITTTTPGWFIHTGSGNDAVKVTSGANVIDGSTGSNFLTGGSGNDTFFVDDRSPAAQSWDTINNFHSRDSATVWGVTTQDFTLNWVDGEGAAGYTGLTLHAIASGVPTASLTLVGYTASDLTNGKLMVTYGRVAGSNYMYVHAN